MLSYIITTVVTISSRKANFNLISLKSIFIILGKLTLYTKLSIKPTPLPQNTKVLYKQRNGVFRICGTNLYLKIHTFWCSIAVFVLRFSCFGSQFTDVALLSERVCLPIFCIKTLWRCRVYLRELMHNEEHGKSKVGGSILFQRIIWFEFYTVCVIFEYQEFKLRKK